MAASTPRQLHDIGETVARADEDVRGRIVLDDAGYGYYGLAPFWGMGYMYPPYPDYGPR